MRKMELVDRERYEVLKTMLQDRAREITDKLRDLRETLPDELADVKDPEEQCVHEFVHGLDFALIDMKSQTLERINEALGRLEEGTYGICADCGETIGSARLQALPFAGRCRNCQEAREEIAAETAKQQSRFELPARLDSEPSEAPAPAAPTRPARDLPRIAPRRAPVGAGTAVRRVRPGQLALRQQVQQMERASSLRRPSAPAPTPRPGRPRAASARAARRTTTRSNKPA